ncbi:uncharacterized protein LOC126884574 isoform X2 [Diabrotica virgifera virgifera]|uniref:MADF domain-containing protein n=1 Tax=Diabrotica virgifera virgifera TaxID=50390 RepID=A0ABM5K8J7_DIAVI|nr:uncharacterized protein LOC126884574 isoform X2 [Diabrotica virgifera virgifera]
MGENMDYDMKLIEEVKRYPELYDSSQRNFKNKVLKAALWKDIAFKMRKQTDEYSIKTVRMRWKSLRDSYVKEIKYKMAVSSGHILKPRKNWRYSNCMTFLAPFLAISFPNTSKIKDESCEIKEEVSDQSEPTDPTYFLNGVADTVKKLSAVNQVFIQRSVVNMVLDIKLREAHEKANILRESGDND